MQIYSGFIDFVVLTQSVYTAVEPVASFDRWKHHLNRFNLKYSAEVSDNIGLSGGKITVNRCNTVG